MFGRSRRRSSSAAAAGRSAEEVADGIRALIIRLDAQRSDAARMAGRVLATRAEVRQACDDQLRVLAETAREAAEGEELARRAAGDGGRDDDPDLIAFTQTAEGLRTVQDALALAAEPLHTLLAEARDNAERARQVVARAQEVFDEQVRTQVRLLGVLERAERARILREARR